MAPKKDKVPSPSSKPAKSGGGKQKKKMSARNYPAESIKLPKLVDISGDASKVVCHYSNLLYVRIVAGELTKSEFKRLEDSPLNPIVKLGMREGINFSGKLFQFMMEKRVELKRNMMWFTFASQLMRFSEREFFLTTSLPFAAEENAAPLDLLRVETKYSWMKSEKIFKDLIALLQDKKIERTECEKLSLASLILVEGIILGRYTAKIIATSSLQEVLNFEDYIRKPWGKIGFEFLRTQIVKMSAEGTKVVGRRRRVFLSESRKDPPKPGEKFFATFPFPYMNGYLHIGHAFSLFKADFASAYHRLRGANVLLPFGFHCTGGRSRRRLRILVERFISGRLCGSFGLSDGEIAKFQDPYEWLRYFSPVAVEDLRAYGLGCDWRRSFVTTDVNPFFDAFVRWQMRKLKSMGKIVKDLRYTIFSPFDGQPCADRDRASGEGVQPQEYTLIKMEVAVKPLPLKLGPSEGKRVFLAAATLRPETMYGQTNAWNFSKTPQKKPSCLVELTGCDLIGLPLRSPLAAKEIIYALPMLTVLANKGTGIVTSVPSDAPDDYMALQDLISKPDVRAKYGVKDEWVPSDIVPVINIPGFGDKRLTYLKGFTEGTMLIGEFAGRKVQEIKPIIKTKLVESGEAILYRQPENPVMSRSGDECVVALTDQWTLRQAIEEFSATATRFSFADAGDGLGDASFVFETANAAILRLTKELTWMEEVLAAESSLRTGPPSTYADKVFENDMNIAIKLTEKAYKDCLFREALKNGFYDLQAARDEYRLSCGMNHDLILTFMDVQTRLIEPICPHFAEYVWRKLLKKQGCVVKAGWPTTSNEPDLVLKGANKYLQDSIVSMIKILSRGKLESERPCICE
ncbi:hypothetical protein F2Q69_00060569 [Brassica cretica]|uniref:leucine--tRNA ligase n=1 Tax=Brassica cretica TaxID=69181 RepID=A0A8S9RN53_BRACR|nr:hypothetical protein F2Q69_00060569 [Brassica cretica]